MNYAQAMRELLEPLRVYHLEGTLNGGELDSLGAALDACGAVLEEIQREMLLSTARQWAGGHGKAAGPQTGDP